MLRLLAIPALVPLLFASSCAEVGRGFPEDMDAADSAPPVNDVPGPGPDATGTDAPADEGSLDPGEPSGDPGADSPRVDDPGVAGDPGEDGSGLDPGGDAGPVDEPPCTPCLSDDDCPEDAPCTEKDAPQGSFCGAPCPEPGCTEESEGSKTECKVTNEHGTCTGGRECAGGELTACSAPVPAVDVCDGQDNDCDGETDPGAVDTDSDGEPDCIDGDDDGDGVADEEDGCPLVKDPTQEDMDGDGIGDACDPDLDGDGVHNAADCAPEDPKVTVATPEKCDGVDNDCDGKTDEQDAKGCKLHYPDADGDGYGANLAGKCLCGPEAPYTSTVAGDCNDSSAAAGPLAPEKCDLVDNDCDGLTDEPGSLDCADFFFDQDGDGFALQGAAMKCLCAPDPYTLHTALGLGDCDDGDPFVYPGAPERCNGLDESCDGSKDEGCDDDGDGYCDSDLVYGPQPAGATCSLGPGDCDDSDPNVYPGAPEICDGKDSNCFGGDDKAEGTAAACGPECKPCPDPGDTCTGLGPAGQCVDECPAGTFCEDCTCNGAVVLALGPEVKDAKVLYDAKLDTFRVAYSQSGTFMLRAVSATGALGNDVMAVASVSKWTEWGVDQSPADGSFLFAWTGYPDSAVHIGVANATGAYEAQFVAVPDVAGALQRQNVQIAWSSAQKNHLVVWDETVEDSLDVRGVLLDPLGSPASSTFLVAGGPGDQSGPSLAARGGAKGYVLSYSTVGATGSAPVLALLGTSGAVASQHVLALEGKPSTNPKVWYDAAMERGVVQWLGTDYQYHAFLFDEDGVAGEEIDAGAPLGAVVGAPAQGELRVFLNAGGQVWMRAVDSESGVLSYSGVPLSEGGPITKIVGAVRHPTGYALVLWTVGSQLQGRLVAP